MNLPRHIGIIMDGNGRWAKKRGLPRSAGHIMGSKTFRKITEYLYDLGIKVSTFYAFSTENWERPDEEVNSLLKLFGEYITIYYNDSELKHKYSSVRILGDKSKFPEELRERFLELENNTAANASEYQLNIACNYGSRDELCRAFETLRTKEGPVTSEDISNALYTYGQPDVDLIIRTGGEKRLSNFLLWQAAYAELYFTDKLWPDITEKDIDEALEFYSSRERRFGKIDKDNK